MPVAVHKGQGMQIHVSQVPEEGLKEHASYDPSSLDMEREDIRLPEPFEVDADINKVDEQLVVRAAIHCPLRMICGRCLEEFNAAVTPRAIFSYTVRTTDVVDITDDVRQEIILAYPMIPLCSPGCKGLCVACGQNLNHGSCAHQAAPDAGPAPDRGGR